MSIDNGSIFVERRTYRRRRLVDAARLLPILGVILVYLPLLWTGNRAEPTSTTYAMIYFFGLWLALVLGAVLLSRHLKTEVESDDAGPRDESTDSDGSAEDL